MLVGGGRRLSESARSVIPFSRPFQAESTLECLRAVLESDHAHGDGPLTRSAPRSCAASSAGDVLLTTSGTHALEMAALLLDLRPGDEVIVPVLHLRVDGQRRGPARRDDRCSSTSAPDTLNLDETRIEDAITPRTRAISAGALRRRRLSTWTPSCRIAAAPWPRGRRGQRARAVRRLRADGSSARFGAFGDAELPRHEEPVRAARAAPW